MLGNYGQVRRKVVLSRTPPWRRWVRSRETVPDISYNKSVDVNRVFSPPRLSSQDIPKISMNDSTLVSSTPVSESIQSEISNDQKVTDLLNTVTQIRKFLIPSSFHARRSVKALDRVCLEAQSMLPTLSEGDKIRVLCAFGELKGYVVTNRVADRYNTRKLSYVNSEFYCALIDSVAWASAYSHHLSKVRSLVPTLHVVRTLSRMKLDKERVQKAISSILTDLLRGSDGIERRPAHLTELVMLASKNRVSNSEFFNFVVADVESSFNAYSQDLLGDLSRSFTALRFYSHAFHNDVLSQKIPLIAHELAWWNLVDIAEYFSQVVPAPLSDLDAELAARFSNECWKWIPEMRCGYAAKALKVLTDLNETGEKRTIRSLIRAIPRSLDKLHPYLVAESIVAAAKFGYSPKKRYGKQPGWLLYRRLAFSLSKQGAAPPLQRVAADLVVSTVQAISSVKGKSQVEFFDSVMDDVAKDELNRKYSIDHLVNLQRLFDEQGLGFKRGVDLLSEKIESRKSERMQTNNLAFLASGPDSSTFYPQLVQEGNDLNDLHINNVIRLLSKPHFRENHLGNWLDMNLANLSPEDFSKLMLGLALHECSFEPERLQWINLLSENHVGLQPDSLVELIAAIFLLNQLKEPPSRKLFVYVTETPIRPQAVETCQLITGLIRLDPSIKIDNHLHKFVTWIDSHLLSRRPPCSRPSFPSSPWYVPNGAIASLSVFPVNIPLALPDPRLDLRSLHSARSPTDVRRVHRNSVSGDTGTALFLNEENSRETQLNKILKHQYLTRLGWDVKYIESDANVSHPSTVTMALLGSPSQKGNNYKLHRF